jgi:translation initiation factor IF-3
LTKYGERSRFRINYQIRARRIRLIDENGNQVGVLPTEEGLRLAKLKYLDLVEVAPQVEPPVCRILDYKKFRYEQEKQAREAKKKQRHVHLKEVRFKPRIEEHDYQVKLNRIKKFLTKGDRVKITLFFRGRELSHPELGDRLMEKLVSDLSEVAVVEKKPRRDKRFINCILLPK